MHHPGPTADLTVMHVFLARPADKIDRQLARFAAIRAGDLLRMVEICSELIVRSENVVVHDPHCDSTRPGASFFAHYEIGVEEAHS